MLSGAGVARHASVRLAGSLVFVQAQVVYHRFDDRFYKLRTLGIALVFAVNFVTNFFSGLIETQNWCYLLPYPVSAYNWIVKAV